MNAFKVFLSHRYKSPEINLFFFDLFSKHAELQFEVDIGLSATNVTRLERMVRGTDGFVGIYPFPGPPDTVPARDELLHESRYFRLELDLAVRSGKPAFVCYDQRYKNILECPASFAVCTFDPQEITGGGAAPSAAAYERTFAGFCLTIESAMALRNIRGVQPKSPKVGILLPPEKPSDTGYSPEHLATIETLLDGADYEPVRLRWPPLFDGRFLNAAESLDWIVVDVGDDPYGAPALAYLHGRFLPTLRLKRLAGATDEASPLERSLYRGVEVGYMNDVVRWRLPGELESGISARLKVIDLAPRRLSTRAQAEDYFRSAALRKEPVFLSYSGDDAELGGRISAALRKRFQQVFDYRDGKSIRPGQPWLKEIFDQLSAAAIAVPLLSKTYFESGNCEHEAREIVAARDRKKLLMVPVKLYPEKLDVPVWLTDIQQERAFSLANDPDALAQRIVELVKEYA